MIAFPQISKEETKRFSGVWTYNGVAVTLDDTSIQFATDLTNLILKQFALSVQHAEAQTTPAPEKGTIIEA